MYSVGKDKTRWEIGKESSPRSRVLPVTKARMNKLYVWYCGHMVYMCIDILLTLYINILNNAVLIFLLINRHFNFTAQQISCNEENKHIISSRTSTICYVKITIPAYLSVLYNMILISRVFIHCRLNNIT